MNNPFAKAPPLMHIPASLGWYELRAFNKPGDVSVSRLKSLTHHERKILLEKTLTESWT